jgi:acetyl esterase
MEAMPVLDAEITAYYAQLATLFPPLALDATPLARRSRYWTLVNLSRPALPSNVTMNDVQLDLQCGTVPVRLFYGHDGSDEIVPTIIYFHGGGWVVGDIETHTPTCARLAHEANAMVVSVDYPLAPENDWRALTEACWQAAVAIALDRPAGTPIVLAGDSAGAHLAQVVALRARDEEKFHVALQALYYPCIAPTYATESYETFSMGPGLTRADMQYYWQSFHGTDAAHDDYRIAPNRAKSLAGLPPTFLVTSGLDPLRDDGRNHVAALRGAGVSVVHEEIDSLPHGFLRMTKVSKMASDVVGRCNAQIGTLLRSART